jgi:hypothetical protein
VPACIWILREQTLSIFGQTRFAVAGMVRICWDFGHRRSFQGPLAGFEAEGSQPASQPFWISLNSGFLDFDAEREQEWSPYVIE